MDTTNKNFNTYFHNKHLEAGLSAQGLIFDTLHQVSYEKNPGFFRLMEKLVFLYMQSHTKILPVRPIAYGEILTKIFQELDKHSFLFLTNHETYAGPPLLIWELIKWGYDHGSSEIRDHMYTVLGPLLMTHKNYKQVVLPISHALKTLPKTSNLPSDLPHDVIKEHRKLFCTEIDALFKIPGNIVVMAPGGQRDIIERNPDGTVKSVYLPEDDAIRDSLILSQKGAKDGAHIVLVGVNEAELKHPFDVPPGNGKRSTGNTYIDLKLLDKDEFYDLRQRKQVMSTMAQLIKDERGIPLGKVVSAQEFDDIKGTLDTSYLLGRKRTSNFQDSFGKATLRHLFKLFM